MPLHDLAADRQPHAAAFEFLSPVQALERPEDALGVLIVEADAVVRNADLPGAGAVDGPFAAAQGRLLTVDGRNCLRRSRKR